MGVAPGSPGGRQIGDNPYARSRWSTTPGAGPSIKLHGVAAEFLPEAKIHLSLTHDGETAAAVVVLEDPTVPAHVPAVEWSPTPR